MRRTAHIAQQQRCRRRGRALFASPLTRLRWWRPSYCLQPPRQPVLYVTASTTPFNACTQTSPHTQPPSPPLQTSTIPPPHSAHPNSTRRRKVCAQRGRTRRRYRASSFVVLTVHLLSLSCGIELVQLFGLGRSAAPTSKKFDPKPDDGDDDQSTENQGPCQGNGGVWK